jgi:putative transcriptional regulator
VARGQRSAPSRANNVHAAVLVGSGLGAVGLASPRLPDANFYRTTVLIIHHDDGGAFGLVLNRPTGSTVAEVWKALGDESCDALQPINVGGPVEGPLMAIHTNEEYSENEILPGVYFAAHKDHLNRIVAEVDHPFRIFTGYSGWAPGQLEAELEQGGWMTLPARYEHVFGESESAWRAASREIGEQILSPLLRRSGAPKDPSTN